MLLLARLMAPAICVTVAFAGAGFGGRAATGQEFQIGIIDLFGVSRVAASQVRATLTFKEGDRIAIADGKRPAVLIASEDRLARLPGVTRARINIVCCDQGRLIAYVGIEETGAAALRFRVAPQGPARLAADVVQAGEEFSKAFVQAVQRGDAVEDRSEGHALNRDPATRAIQDRFVTYARRDLPELRLVLRTSSDAAHRALAAQVIGYATDKAGVVEDLVQAMKDPSEEVRNNAMRTLLVFAAATPSGSRSVPRIPTEPFVELLSSPVWSDRNKASGALAELSANRDPALLATLRTQALTPLVEMARWQSEGHASAAFTILGRIAGYSDEAARMLLERGDRATVISAALNRR